MRARFVVAVAMALLCGVAPLAHGREGPEPSGPARSEAELYMGGFDGTWVGKLKTIPASSFDAQIGSGKEGDASELALVVQGQAAKVYLRRDGKWSEVKPGAFRVEAHKTNATVTATDSSTDVYDKTGRGGWVETWSFVLTHKTATELYAAWWRAVNNYLEKPGEKSARFFMGAFGELQKVPALPN